MSTCSISAGELAGQSRVDSDRIRASMPCEISADASFKMVDVSSVQDDQPLALAAHWSILVRFLGHEQSIRSVNKE